MADKYYDRLLPGQTITVVLGGSEPDITGTFREYLNGGGTVAVTTPAGENDPNVYVVHHISVFDYLYRAVPSSSANVDGGQLVGQNVTIRYAPGVVPGAELTGLVTAVDRKVGTIQLDVGGSVFLAPINQVWHIEVL